MEHATNLARRRLLVSFVPALTVACSGVDPLAGRRVADASVRPPAKGQHWVYQVRNLYNREIIDEIDETVVSTAAQIRIRRVSREHGALADEIQSPWGWLVQDSYWRNAVRYDRPVPAWPVSVDANWAGTYRTRYESIGSLDDALFWNMSMRRLEREAVSTPAGRFDAAAYWTHIAFDPPQSFFRVASERDQTTWLVPEVGRWVQRSCQSVHFVDQHGGKVPGDELRYELTAWS